MNTDQKKEERSESVFIYVTPTVKRDFEAAKDNQALKQDIIKRFLTNEREWLNDELRQIDESTIKYAAKLVGIKEEFSKCQDAYVEEIEAICSKANETFKKLDSIAVNTRESIDRTMNNLRGIFTALDKIEFHKVERLLSLVDKINGMSPKELELIKNLLNAQ